MLGAAFTASRRWESDSARFRDTYTVALATWTACRAVSMYQGGLDVPLEADELSGSPTFRRHTVRSLGGPRPGSGWQRTMLQGSPMSHLRFRLKIGDAAAGEQAP